MSFPVSVLAFTNYLSAVHASFIFLFVFCPFSNKKKRFIIPNNYKRGTGEVVGPLVLIISHVLFSNFYGFVLSQCLFSVGIPMRVPIKLKVLAKAAAECILISLIISCQCHTTVFLFKLKIPQYLFLNQDYISKSGYGQMTCLINIKRVWIFI